MGDITPQIRIGRRAGARWTLAASTAALALGLLIGTSPAAAQFVCDSTTPGGADGATATGINSFACGTNAMAQGVGSTAIGANAGIGGDPGNSFNTAVGGFAGQSVTGQFNSAFGGGAGSNVTGSVNSAFGNSAGLSVTGNNNNAFGNSAGVGVTGNNNNGFGSLAGQQVTGNGNSAFGDTAGVFVTGNNNSALGIGAGVSVDGNSNSAVGDSAGRDVTGNANNAFGLFTGRNVTGDLNSAFGVNAGNQVQGSNNAAFGGGAGTFVKGNDNLGFGSDAGTGVTGNSNSAFGRRAGRNIEGSGNVAIGQNAGSGPFGNPLVVSNTVAIGTNAVARADGAVAIGNGAEATRPNQVVLGTADYTYSTPGITSAASKAAQSAPTHIVTSNAGGDLAAYTPAELGLATAGDLSGLQSQISGLGRRDQELAEGIAISLALAQPILRGHQTFGLNVGWGNFDGSSALGVTAAGVVSQNALGPGSSVTLYGGVGAGTDNGMVAGRAGVSFGW